ncbi:chitinase [Leifsonia sp. 2MCAF36]|uniref:chitinase n=1 Tax=Leifsonia sp. 2MCAF36 TaxID=3232988 RepID=UPI003F9732A1
MKRAIYTLAAGMLGAALCVATAALPAAAAAVPGSVPAGASAGSSSVAGSHSPFILPALPLPPHFSAPYVDVTSVSDLADLSKESGSKVLSLAFLQTEVAGSCTVYWAGNTATPVAANTFGDAIDRIRLRGGDVVPSFGGYSADTTNTEIADSCTDVHKIALAYENVITTYKVQRLDFDIEADSLSNLAGIDRRNQAIVEVKAWAAAQHRPLSIAYTLPSTPQGLGATGVALLQSAAKYGAPIDEVNIMTFDYWDGATHDMLADAQTAAAGLVGQLRATIAPNASDATLWHKVGIIQMNGIDDFGPQETFTIAQASPLVEWAAAKHINELSFWALQRDNGSCPGVKGANNCSGVVQTPWAFSKAFARFTSWWY